MPYKDTPLLPEGRIPKDVATWLAELMEEFEKAADWEVATIKTVVEEYAKAKDLKPPELFMVIGSRSPGPKFPRPCLKPCMSWARDGSPPHAARHRLSKSA